LVQLVAVLPASASREQCRWSHLCGWTIIGWSGSFAHFANGSADLRNPIGGVVFDNRFESVLNNSSQNWCLYDGYNYSGTLYVVGPGRAIGNEFRNKTSSLKAC
jgi:hypothetical protein